MVVELDVVPINQVANGRLNLAVSTSRVDGTEPRSNRGVGDDVLSGRKRIAECLSECDEPLLGLAVSLVDRSEVLH